MTGARTTVDISSGRSAPSSAHRDRLAGLRGVLRHAQARRSSALERKLVWLLGSPRSGSTWLMYLLNEPPRVATLQEPLIGMHLGLFASSIVENGHGRLAAGVRMRDLRGDDRYFFSDRHATAWGPPLRRLILNGLAPHAPLRARHLVVQEPNGSEGADLLLPVLKRSRLIFLLRDGRDVVDSVLDAYRPGSWLDTTFGVGQELLRPERLRFIEREAQRWVARTEIVARAYESHPPALRLMIRYEDLLSDTSKTLLSVYSWLQLDPPADLEERVHLNSFDAAPTAKGPGNFHRAATPGLWRQNFSEEEQDCCTKIMGPMLGVMGYEAVPELSR